VPAGVRTSLRHALTAGEHSGTVTDSFSYDRPHATAAPRTNILTSQFFGVRVFAKNLGTSVYSPSSSIGGTAVRTSLSLWGSDTSLWCLVPAGVSIDKSMVITIAQNAGTREKLFSYDHPLLLTASPRNLVAARGRAIATVVSLFGGKMGTAGYSPSVRLGNTGATSSVWMSSSNVQCRSGAGWTTASAGVITIARTIGSLTNMFTYDAPSVSTIKYACAPTVGLPTSSVTIAGANFFTASLSPAARLGGSAFRATFWISETSISSLQPSGVAGTPEQVVVTVAQLLATRTEAFTYDQYSVSGAFAADPADDNVIFVYGNNFGNYDATLRRKVGDIGCEASSWVSTTSTRCKLFAGLTSADATTTIVKGMAMCVICNPPQ
ncbi:hypothetical protein T484DRAFT_1849093, partial [Baffinella frigidus]